MFSMAGASLFLSILPLPGRALLWATFVIAAATIAIPFTPLGQAFGLTPLPMAYLMILGVIVVLYMTAAEIAKQIFYRAAPW